MPGNVPIRPVTASLPISPTIGKILHRLFAEEQRQQMKWIPAAAVSAEAVTSTVVFSDATVKVKFRRSLRGVAKTNVGKGLSLKARQLSRDFVHSGKQPWNHCRFRFHSLLLLKRHRFPCSWP